MDSVPSKLIQINIPTLLDKSFFTSYVDQEFIRIFCKRKGRGNLAKTFILPRNIFVDTEFVEAIAMYIGDGKLSQDKNHLDFTSKDMDMIRFMLCFFRNRLNLKLDNIRFTLIFKKFSSSSLDNWSSFLGIPEEKINLKQSNRHKEDCFGMQISGLLRKIFEELVNVVCRLDFFNYPELRKAFLRGLFAAEGSVNIVKKENYIAYIGFHLSYLKEEKLAKLVQSLLKLEGILSKQFLRKDKGERYIQITNWSNYYKLWKMKIFDLNMRKKNVFMNKIRKTNFFYDVKKEFVVKLLNTNGISNRQLGYKLGICPSTLCNLSNNKTSYINGKDLLNLAAFHWTPIDELKENIIGIRVHRSTVLEDCNFVDVALLRI